MEHCNSNNPPQSLNQNDDHKQFVQYPCAACKSLRRRCSEKCILAPYFPSSEPLRFSVIHKVFGACNIVKRLQEIQEHQRLDAVNSMVYEASARISDPVYGCAGAVSFLQAQNLELQEELAKAQAEIFNMQCQISNLASLICKEMLPSEDQDIIHSSEQQPCHNSSNLSMEPFIWTYEQVMDIYRP